MFSNVPQAWNLNRAIAAKNQAPVVVAVIDTDSFASSADIPFASGSDLRPSQALLHGTMVSSVLGSSHNKQGIDGVTPFASIRARGYDTWPDILGAGVARSLFGGHAASLALTLGWLLANPARVVNMSIGFELAACNPQTLPPPVGVIRPPCDPVAAARTIDQSGDVFAAVARILDKGDRGSLFVVAAGNDSEPFRQSTRDAPNTPPEERVRGYSARWASPWCNAAVRNKAPNILAVEAISRWGANSYSNIDSGGMLAPGDEVGVSIDGITVGLGSGTSVAAPLVAGAAAFLLAVEPMLKTSQLKTLLKDAPYAAPASSINWSTTNTRLDLLASVIGIDDVLNRPERPVQRMLCDIDDGTADGFARFTHVAGEDGGTLAVVTEDKTAGDGHVDMKDFRRFRDEWLRVHLTDLVPELVQLDDPLDTPVVLSTGKGEVESFYPPGGILRDANRSGTGKAGELEMFPRSEWTSVRYSTFNAATAAFLPSRGTGSWTNRHHRGNALSGLDAALVPFKEVFEEGAAGGEGWKKSDLPALLRWSGDVHIIVSDIAKCGGGMTIDLTGERAWYERDADAPPAVASLAPLAGRRITRSNTELVVTTPLRSKVKLTWTADNAESGVHEITRDVPLGGDGYVVLQCQEPAKCAAEQACTSVVPRCLTENHQVFNKVRSDSTGVFAPAAGFACPQVDPCDFYCSS
jgi:hypothetical protein